MIVPLDVYLDVTNIPLGIKNTNYVCHVLIPDGILPEFDRTLTQLSYHS